jgi:hypothetical protein
MIFSEAQSLMLCTAAHRAYHLHLFSPSLSRFIYWRSRLRDPGLPGYCGHLQRVAHLRAIGSELLRLQNAGLSLRPIQIGAKSMPSCAQILGLSAWFYAACHPFSNGFRQYRALADAIRLEMRVYHPVKR